MQRIGHFTVLQDISTYNIYFNELHNFHRKNNKSYTYSVSVKDIITNTNEIKMLFSRINEPQGVLNFLRNKYSGDVLGIEEVSEYLLKHSNSFLLLGGRGHWSYAINEKILSNGY
mgnify:CR=1 FL=1